MIRLITVIITLLGLMGFLVHVNLPGTSPVVPESLMALGFTMIAAYLIGKTITRFQLPQITGFILAGILTGPFVINLLSEPVVENLQLIDHIALSFIALTAGGEFRYKVIRQQLKTISSAIFWQVVVVLAAFVAFIFIYKHHIPFLNGQSGSAVLGVGLILGSLFIATSPAATIAIITETRAWGRFTDFVLGVVVIKDVVVVLIFSVVLSVAQPLILVNSHLHLGYVISVLLEVILSIVVGLGAGALILLYLKYIRKQTPLFLLGFALLGIELSTMLHLEMTLIFMVAGFFVQNFSNAGSKLIKAIEASSLPIYVIFFAIAGASLNFSFFLQSWLLALFVVGIRMLATWCGTYLGGRLTKAPSNVNQYGWMGFVGQAGLSLGLSALVVQNISGSIGVSIRTLIVAVITLNEIIGPILFRYALAKTGEIHLETG